MFQNNTHVKKYIFFLLLTTVHFAPLFGQQVTRTIPTTEQPERSQKSPAYRWKDSYLNRFSFDLPRSPLLFIQSDSLSTTIQYSPEQGNIVIDETLAEDIEVKIPQAMSFNEYSSIQNAMVRKSILREYEQMQDGNSATSGRGLSPLIQKAPLVDRIFGGKVPEFKPNGFVAVDLRFGSQYINNPELSLFQRRRPIFDFDQQISINFNNNANGGAGTNGLGQSNPFGNNSNSRGGGLNDLRGLAQKSGALGSLGGGNNPYREKMGILGNFDTKSAFNFENQFKLNFKSDPEDILQSLEAGNVSFPLRSQLVPGVDNLFGVKAGLRFGKLDVSTVVAQQRARTESIYISGGARNRPFEVRCDEYDENRHFFLSHFFRDQYEKSLSSLPMVTSEVLITRIEVYVTNRTNTVTSMRNLVGLTDLGEPNPYADGVTVNNPNFADNSTNSLGEYLSDETISFRKIDNTNSTLEAQGLKKGVDFELLRGAKKLTEREFDFHPQLGYISLLTPLRNDEILAVAYEYVYRGKNYKVGELTEDYSFRAEDDVIAMKLLKSSTIRNRLDHPMWDLMMKNVYSLSQGNIEREGFQLRVIYKDDKTGMDTPQLHEGENLKNKPLISVLGLDDLNYNNDHRVGDEANDGNFDYVEGVTVNEERGVIIFPVLEPFGSFLETKFTPGEQTLKDKYVFDELYDQTLTDAQQINTKNKFFLQGSVQNNSNDIPLPLGASGSSVRVYSGGTELQQGADYMVDAQLGRIRITNPSILASGRPIRIDYERPDLFQSQIRRLFGLRMDYTVSKNLRIGGTLMDLRENTPGFLTRTAIGNEPVDNTLWGVDINYKQEGSGLTRLLDKLPLIQTKEPSAIVLSAEFAQLLPGVNNKKINGNAMIDDFEASRNINDLTRQPNRWKLGSTPLEFRRDTIGNPYGYNYKRAKIAAYTIDQTSFLSTAFGGNGIVPTELTNAARNNLYERSFVIQEIFPGRTQPVFGQNLPTNILDVAYFPEERGMYNYNPDLTEKGLLKEPEENFGALMRGITFDTDFDNANVEFLEFWLLNPFSDEVRDGIRNKRNETGGKLIFQLGDISEDVIPDNYFNFENGIPANDSAIFTQPIATAWGNAPKTQFITDAFSTDDEVRERQDIGLDGLSNEDELEYPHIKEFLNKIETVVTDPAALQEIKSDPSGDDFNFFLDDKYTLDQFMVERHKNYLGMENNSPPLTEDQIISNSNTISSDKEDINQDNTISDIDDPAVNLEIDLRPNGGTIQNKYIVDTVSSGQAQWYQFRVPLRELTDSSGTVNLKSIRFIRMLMTEWEEPVVLRFATLQLVSNQYRTYYNDLNDYSYAGVPQPNRNTAFKVSSVSVEENGCDVNGDCNVKDGQTPYVVPPGFIRDRDFSTTFTNQLFNEQSLRLEVEDLKDGDKRGVFKNTDLNLNMYKRLQMFVHMESEDFSSTESDTLAGAFIRFGTDLRNNFYEVEIPKLTSTPHGSTVDEVIWPEENDFNIPIDVLRDLKLERITSDAPFEQPFTKDVTFTIDGRNELPMTYTYKLTIVGNPDLSSIQTFMMGVSNSGSGSGRSSDFVVWMDELRANGFDQTAGEAAILAADIKLADLGTVSVSANYSTFGFGGVQDRISSRAQDNSLGFGIASTFELDRLFPEKWGLSIPLFMNYDKQEVIPEFDPLNPDLVLERALTQFEDPDDRQAYRDLVVDRNINRGFNLANIRKIKTNPNAKNHFYDIENFSFSYSQNSIQRSNVLIQEYYSERKRGAITYQFQPKTFLWEPFKNAEGLQKPMFTWLKDFNLSPVPELFAFRTDFDRNFSRTQYRNSDLTTDDIAPNFIKYFLTNRYYDMQWGLTKSINLTYSAVMNSIIDEPFGDIGTEANREAVWDNLLSFGRAKNFNQNIQATYRLPLDKFFLLDWVQADSRFEIDYNYRANAWDWTQGDDIEDAGLKDSFGSAFGNYIDNSREMAVQGRIDLVKLYNKIKYLKFANSPSQPKERFTRAPGDDEDIMVGSSDALKTFTRLLMTVRGINFNYSIVQNTILPGFLQSPDFFGLSKNTMAPGLPFVLGSQRLYGDDYGKDILTKSAENGWLSKSAVRNDPFTQGREKKFDFSTNLEPFKGFRMQIRGNYSRGDSYQVLYRPGYDDKGNPTDAFEAQNPFRNGTFSMSFWSFKTGFFKLNKDPYSNYNYKVFDDMKAYREVVIEKLNLIKGGEAGGYHVNSQDVLIPAFFAAYSGNSVDKIFEKSQKRGSETFNPFLRFPLPNWRVDYSGVEKLPLFKKLFRSVSISHSYSSNYSVGNFTSSHAYGSSTLDEYGSKIVNLLVSDYPIGKLTAPGSIIDGVASEYYLPVFIMSTITMEERFSPLIGVQFATKGALTGRVEYNKERRASLNLSNAQVAEYNSNSLVISAGFRKAGVKLPFKGRDGNSMVLENDLNFNFGLTLSDVTALQRRLDGETVPIQGNYVVQIKPQIQYQFNKKLNLGFYVEHFVNEPFTSLSYETRRTVGGINMKFNLAD
ncbi:T9SS outer membrane translocon Sov/SprA [Jiulongibacter sp. NS-SX5]|uniref:T9SS outer membrane translocon Sov/SprA n=1 Tax=Jiulongibacter sp. NS-SX5 TaxID=3463854 RepID=UPI0040591231